ncbi:carboxyl transferase domain-containing protein [Sphingomonas mucosissima]|uniref:Putative propionyl-CoA carboxylase beta chain 5 n=1 Tax=Sphingomonas mucosissima TaxID=370959 RepID=A0A245ZHB0_9SPHN|nr:carboxyl transferase domain-containing protein [Sphingomonas mucosissima]OWK29135.1 putative propionyl-CoA carboxylase beta chain 5 [Sphingomonas mucosissima]
MAAIVEEREGSAAQHACGRLTARERLDILFDEASFVEPGPAGHGVVTGLGLVQGRPVAAFSQDVTDAGGTITRQHAEKIGHLIDRATSLGAPIVGLYDSPGSALDEGLSCLAAQAAMLQQSARAQGRVPQMALVFGHNVGTAALAPALADVTFMLDRASALYLAGPATLRRATGEIASVEALGGPSLHATRTGMADGVFANEIDLLLAARDLLDLLPSASDKPPPQIATGDPYDREEPALDKLVPLDPTEPYDMRDLARAIVDEGELFEIQPGHAANVICGFGRTEGRTIGIIGNQPMVMGGAIDSAAARKAAQFALRCDRFGVPIVTLLDSPGFLPGAAEESRGIVADAANLLAALARASVPRITIVTRRALGTAWTVLGPQPTTSSPCYAWPGAEIAAMTGNAAAELLFDEGEDQKKRDYAARIADPSSAVDAGFVDAVIPPAATRRTIAEALRRIAPHAQGSGSLLPIPSPNGAGHMRERDRNG